MKINIDTIPELKTEVGIHGSAKQKEVGGPICASIVVGILLLIVGD